MKQELRARRIRRLAVVAVALLLLGAGGVGAYQWRQRDKDATAREQLQEGLAAFERHDYEGTMAGLAKFLGRLGPTEGTSEHYRIAADARRHLPLPNNRHLSDAISYLQYALFLDAGDRKSQSDLLDLYETVGYWAEARDLIGKMLAATPEDADLLGRRATISEVLGDLPAALRDAEAAAAADPSRLESHVRIARLRTAVGDESGKIEAWLDDVLLAHPGEIRFRVLKAFGLFLLSRRERNDAALLEKAEDIVIRTGQEAETIEDRGAVGLLVVMLDAFGRYDESMDVLNRAIRVGDSALQTAYVRGLWYRRRIGEIPGVVAAWREKGASLQPEALALTAAVLRSQGDETAADRLVGELRASSSPSAEAWVAALPYLGGVPAGERSEAMTVLAALREAAPESAPAALAYGLAFADGDPDVARGHWLEAADLAAAWAEPLRLVAQSMLRSNMSDQALEHASEALRRAPDDPTTIATYTDAVVANADRLTEHERQRFVADLERARDASSGALAVHFGTLQAVLLAKKDDPATEERLLALLRESESATEASLLRLARLAASVNSAHADEFLKVSELHHGLTPWLASARARIIARRDVPQAALERFDADRSRARTEETGFEWDRERAALLESLGLPDAGAAWVALADGYADRLEAQKGCVASAAAWSDREGIGRAIARMRELTGDQAATWRIARGRWLASAPGATDAEMANAVRLLKEATDLAPRSLQARMELGHLLERMGGSDESAQRQYEEAQKIAPGNTAIDLDLARLKARRGDRDEARRALEEVLARPGLNLRDLIATASMLASQGGFESARRALEQGMPLEGAPRDGVLLLAELCARLGDTDRALRLCDALLVDSDLGTLVFAARLNAQLGRAAEAQALVTKMGEVGAAPRDVARARAGLAESFGSDGAALNAYAAMVDADPQSDDAWIDLLHFVVSRGATGNLKDILNDPRASGVAAVAWMRADRELVVGAVESSVLRLLVLDGLAFPAERETLIGVLRDVEDTVRARADLGRLAERVEALARDHSRLLSLHLLAVDLFERSGDRDQAITIAKAAAEGHPTAVAPASVLTRLLEDAERWRLAADAAQDWRRRIDGPSLAVDARIARALAESGRLREALRIFDADRQLALAAPDANRGFLIDDAAMMARAGDLRRAEELLRPLLRVGDGLGPMLYLVSTKKLGSPDAAIGWLQMLERLVPPQNFDDRVQLARRWSAAWEAFPTAELLKLAEARVNELVSDDRADVRVHYLAALFAERTGRVADAERLYRRGLVLDEKDVSSRNNLAMLLARTGRGEEAVTEALRAVELAPGSAQIKDTLGTAYAAAGRWQEAKDAYEAALERAPDDTSIMLHRAETLVQLRRWAALGLAVSDIARLEALRPTFDAAEQAHFRALRDRVQ